MTQTLYSLKNHIIFHFIKKDYHKPHLFWVKVAKKLYSKPSFIIKFKSIFVLLISFQTQLWLWNFAFKTRFTASKHFSKTQLICTYLGIKRWINILSIFFFKFRFEWKFEYKLATTIFLAYCQLYFSVHNYVRW